MNGDFDDILGKDAPGKEENKTDKPTNKSFRILNDAYQKAQKRWKIEEEVKKEAVLNIQGGI